MLKKVFLGALFLGLIAILVVGAVNRTVAKNADVEHLGSQGQGWARTQADDPLLADGQGAGLGRGRQQVQTGEAGQVLPAGRGRNATARDLLASEVLGRGRTAAATESQASAQGAGRSASASGVPGKGQGAGQGASVSGSQGNGQGRQSQAIAGETIEGIVLSVDDDQMTLLTDNGELQVTDRPWRFAVEQGFQAEVGQRVRLNGFYEDDELEVSALRNLSSTMEVQIRQQGGRPLWAGGNGGGRGNTGASEVAGQNPIAESEDHQWQSLSGTVLSVDEVQMTVSTGDGEIVVADRPWDFALGQGFTAQVNDSVTLYGFYENNTFEVGRLINGSQDIAIREQSGRPMWAGGGRGRWS